MSRTLKEILEQDFDGKTYEELEGLFEEHLNEVYETVSICGYSYEAGTVLKEVDPTAFRCGCSDWTSEEYEEVGDLYYSKSDLNEAEETEQEEQEEEEQREQEEEEQAEIERENEALETELKEENEGKN